VERPDVILLDIAMPEMDGFAFLDELRRSGAISAVPVVILTSLTLSPEELRRVEPDSEVLSKMNLSRETLIAAIRHAVGAREVSVR
jgi:CheY-like chemotaxis protein